MIQIHGVSTKTHRNLKKRAAQNGMTLMAFLRNKLDEIADTPDIEDVLAEIRNDPPVKLSEPPEETIRKIREYGEDFDDDLP